MTEKITKEVEDGTQLNLKVKPSSNEFLIKEVNPWRNQLNIEVSSPPQKGKANKELIQKLGETLGKEIELVSGERSSTKKILVRNINEDELREKLGI